MRSAGPPCGIVGLLNKSGSSPGSDIEAFNGHYRRLIGNDRSIARTVIGNDKVALFVQVDLVPKLKRLGNSGEQASIVITATGSR